MGVTSPAVACRLGRQRRDRRARYAGAKGCMMACIAYMPRHGCPCFHGSTTVGTLVNERVWRRQWVCALCPGGWRCATGINGCEAVPIKWAVLLGPANARNSIQRRPRGP